MIDKEIERRCSEEIKKGNATLVTSRTCDRPDIDGVRKILKEHPNISIINLSRSFDCLVVEAFYEIHDKELAGFARKRLEKEWLEEER